MDIRDEAQRRYPEDYKTVGGSAMERRAFIAGAEWARVELLEELAKRADEELDWGYLEGTSTWLREIAKEVTD